MHTERFPGSDLSGDQPAFRPSNQVTSDLNIFSRLRQLILGVYYDQNVAHLSKSNLGRAADQPSRDRSFAARFRGLEGFYVTPRIPDAWVLDLGMASGCDKYLQPLTPLFGEHLVYKRHRN